MMGGATGLIVTDVTGDLVGCDLGRFAVGGEVLCLDRQILYPL